MQFLLDKYRTRLKSGRLAGVYVHLRRIKRKLKNEQHQDYLSSFVTPLTRAELVDLLDQRPDQPRVLLSLAMWWLLDDGNESGAANRALACARSAEFFDFEATERLQLWKAFALLRCGSVDRGRPLANSLDPSLLTEYEEQIRTEVLGAPLPNQPTVPRRALSTVRERVESIQHDSLVVFDDSFAESADWSMNSRFLLISPEVTGLSISDLRLVGQRFGLGLGSIAARLKARDLGISFGEWIECDFADA